MHGSTPRRRLLRSAAGAGLLSLAALAGAGETAPASPPDVPPGIAAPLRGSFVDDATAGFDARTYYRGFDRPGGNTSEAWAIGGKLYGRTGFWRENLQLGASWYVSLPVYAPADEDGTGLLAAGQEAIAVLGELYARLRLGESAEATLGRQEIEMSAPRPKGVRANRSDGTYVGRLDNRMVPLTYEAVRLGGDEFGGTLRWHAGWIGRVKPRDDDGFVPAGEAAGAAGSDSDLWMAGLQFSPVEDAWLQGWVHEVPDVIRIGFLDADAVARRWAGGHLRLGGQLTDQRSVGAATLTGQPFSTRTTQLYGELGVRPLSVYGAWSSTGSGADLRTPFSSGPIYTQLVTRSFVRAGEDAWLLGAGVDLGAWVPGLSGWVDFARGTGARDVTSGAALGDEEETDLGVAWALKRPGSWLDGLRARFRVAWIVDRAPGGDQRTTDLRIDVNLPVRFF